MCAAGCCQCQGADGRVGCCGVCVDVDALQEFGPEWAKEHLVPQVLAMVKNPHYLYRMTVLVAISSLANYVSQEVFVGTMLPVLVQCAKDRVPNVKFNVAKVGFGGGAVLPWW